MKTAVNKQPTSARTQQPNAVKRLQAISAGAERLWQEAVAARTPVSNDAAACCVITRIANSFLSTHSTSQVVIEGELKDKQWLASRKWSNNYLRSAAVSACTIAKLAVVSRCWC